MIPVHQTKFGLEDGNCLQAAIASVLELPLKRVPNLTLVYNRRDDWRKALDEFLYPKGLQHIVLHSVHPDNNFKPFGYHLIGVKSARGDWNHELVGFQGKPVHDPFPDGNCKHEGIVDYTFFVSLLRIGK